mgnify:CR=1 FL=1
MSSAPAAEKSFAELAKKYKPKLASVLALKHVGPSKQYTTESGSEIAHDGDYVVQVGEIEQTETIPPSTNPRTGERTAGGVKLHRVPKLEVMKAEDFQALYEV